MKANHYYQWRGQLKYKNKIKAKNIYWYCHLYKANLKVSEEIM